jgi:hypothetical protein
VSTYAPPVESLLSLGRPTGQVGDGSYPPYPVGPEHVPELIRLVQDRELEYGEEPACYGQIHAWRALAQLQAVEAVEPLLDLLAAQGDDLEDWNDWATEEVPRVLGMVGPAALAPAAARLEASRRQEWPAVYFARTLTEIAQRHPETRGEVVDRLERLLSAADSPPEVNGWVVSFLVEITASEAWPLIEGAFTAGRVDPSIAGDMARVKWKLGLGPEPPRRAGFRLPGPFSVGTSAKQRHDERKRKERAEKKKRKKERRGR